MQTATNFVEQGKFFSDRHQWEQAILAYQQAIAIAPNWGTSHYHLGETLANLERWDEAILSYQNAIRLDPNLPGIYKKIALVLEQRAKANREAMLDVYLKGIERDPDELSNYHRAIELQSNRDANLYLGLANALNRQEKWDEAIVIYQMAITIDPNLTEAHRHLAKILTNKGQVEAANESWYRVLQSDPSAFKPEEHFQIGNSLLEKGKITEAIACYRQVIKQQPNFFQAYYNLGQALNSCERWDEAIRAYQSSLALEPNYWEAYHHLGDVFSKKEQYQEAVKNYLESIRLNPSFSWSYHNLGYALIQIDRPADAVKAFFKAIELKDDFVWSHYNLGEALLELERWDEAILAYQRAEELQSDLPYLAQKLSYLFHQKAKTYLHEARKYYWQILSQEPQNLEAYSKLLEIEQDNPELYLRFANLLGDNQQINRAIIAYDRALELNPHLLEAKIGRDRLKEKQKELPLGFLGGSNSSSYALWLQENLPTVAQLQQMSEKLQQLTYKPLISIIVPVYNIAENILKATIESVFAQIYSNWELCIADDASTEPHIKKVLEEYTHKDTRVKVYFRQSNGHIAAASNSALSLASGEFISLLDHDDLLTNDALYQVVELLNRHPEADLIYSDEDKIDELGQLSDPYFKPDWSPDTLLSQMYTCHFSTYRRALVKQIGAFRVGYEGSQDYDLVLRFTEISDRIFHIPKILYHWRIHSGSAASNAEVKPYAYLAGARALQDALQRRNSPGRVISHPQVPGVYNIRYQIREYKKISIIIPTRNLGNILDRCLRSIFTRSTYPNYEVIIIDNGSDEPETLNILKTWQTKEPSRLSCYPLDIPFNYSYLNNYATLKATGDYFLFLNNDTEIITEDWLEAMVEQAQRKSIGAVGARLLYPDNTIQHAGVILGIGSIAGHSHKYFSANAQGYFRHLLCINNYSAVTGACLMCRKEVFEELGGFNEILEVAFNDVDFCLNLIKKGYRNVCLPHVVLYHYESKSRGLEDTPGKQKRFQKEVAFMEQNWGNLINRDPYYNANLTKTKEDFSLKIKSTIEVITVQPNLENNSTLWGFSVDFPQVGKIYNQSLTFGGWVLAKKSQATSVEIFYKGQTIQKTLVRELRPDVANIYPQVVEAKNCGFVTIVDLGKLVGKSELVVKVVLQDFTRIELAKIVIGF